MENIRQDANEYLSLLAAGIGVNDLIRLLGPSKYRWHIVSTETGKSALDFLRKKTFSFIVSTDSLPDIDVDEFLESVKSCSPESMCCILTGDRETLSSAFQSEKENFTAAGSRHAF